MVHRPPAQLVTSGFGEVETFTEAVAKMSTLTVLLEVEELILVWLPRSWVLNCQQQLPHAPPVTVRARGLGAQGPGWAKHGICFATLIGSGMST